MRFHLASSGLVAFVAIACAPAPSPAPSLPAPTSAAPASPTSTPPLSPVLPATASSSRAPTPPLCARRAARYTVRLPVPIAGVTGLSDLVRDGAERFWAVEERAPPGTSPATREIVRVDLGDTAHPRVPERLRFELPQVLDAESLVHLGPDLFAVGTEVQPDHVSEGSRTSDLVFVVAVQGGSAHVEPGAGWELPYAPWGRAREANHGIEGMCAAGDRVLMASEQRVGADPVFAPLVLRDRRSGTSVAGKLRLADEGRISALTCCEAPEGALDVMGIQRGLLPNGASVHRLIGFHVPATPSALDVTLDLDVDLEPLYAGAGGVGLMPNLEGLAPLDERSIAVITDDSPRDGAQLVVLTAMP